MFRIEKYADLADLPHGGEFNPSNPKVKALINDWVDQFSQLFPSPFVHIGFDETWQIAQAAKLQGPGATPAKLFIEQLNTVASRIRTARKTRDGLGRHYGEVPRYRLAATSRYYRRALVLRATPDPEYKFWLVPLVAKGVPHVVASGVNNWGNILPDFDMAFENIDTFLAAGRKSKALGLITHLERQSTELAPPVLAGRCLWRRCTLAIDARGSRAVLFGVCALDVWLRNRLRMWRRLLKMPPRPNPPFKSCRRRHHRRHVDRSLSLPRC